MQSYSVIIAGAGASTRFNNKKNKLLSDFNDKKTVIEKTIKIFLNDQFCTQIIIGVNQIVFDFLQKKSYFDNRISYIFGGPERVDTINKCINESHIVNEMVMIHDGARCFASKRLVDNLNRTFSKNDCKVLIPVLPVVDALKKIKGGVIQKTLYREDFVVVQTPQVFKKNFLIKLYNKYSKVEYKDVIYDDSHLVEIFANDVKVHTIKGDKTNIKITYFEDLQNLME